MSKESLLRRMLASQAWVDQRKLQTGFLGREDHDKLQNALGQLVESRIFIDDTAGISLAEMRAKARRLKQNAGGLDLVVVDYLQLMSATLPSGGGKRYENRTQEVSAISRGLKALAKELNVPVVALSQLSRASERRGDDKRPLLSDLRESGSIEQDADVVAFIHREVLLQPRRGDVRGRQGQVGDHHRQAAQRPHRHRTSELHLASYTRFENPDYGARSLNASRRASITAHSESAPRARPSVAGRLSGIHLDQVHGKAMLCGRKTRRFDRNST